VEISVSIDPRQGRLEFQPKQCLRWLLGLLLFAVLSSTVNAQATYPINESFKTNTASGWSFGPALSGTPPSVGTPCPTGNLRPAYLTSGSPDPTNNGWLRLTNNCNNQKGYAIFDTPFSTPQGVSIEFEYKTWGGTHADGLTVFLFDGATAASSFNPGDFGGSLGYANGCGGVAGATTGYLGLGFDEFGNFSNPADRCKNGGPGRVAQRVTLRGTAGAGYPYLTQSTALANDIDDNSGATSRPSDAVFFRKVLILVEPIPASALYRITVKWQTVVGGTYTTLINAYTMPIAPPSNLKIGFAASTGGSTNYHEIRNLSIQKPTNLKVVKTLSSGFVAPLNPLANVSYTLAVTNEGPNGVSDAVLTDTISNLIENVAFTCTPGTGSSCSSPSGSLPLNILNLTLALPFNGTATITVTGRLKATAATRTIPNTALISLPATSQFNDLNPNDDSSTINTLVNGFTIKGVAFQDSNANAFYDVGLEARISTGTYLPTLSGTDDLGNPITAITATAVTTPVAGDGFQNYIFNNLPVGNYTITGVNRSTAGDVFTTPNVLTTSITTSNLINQWFGYFAGRKLTGTVFTDDGRTSTNTTTLTNANNALQNTGEFGVQNIAVSANGTLSTGGTAVTMLAKTDLQGLYTLWVPSTWSANVTVSHTSSVPTGTNRSGASIVLASSFDISSARSLALPGQVNGSEYNGLNFGLVPRNVLQPDQFGSTSSPGSVRYLHFFRPGTLGTMTLATSSSGGFNYIFYRDTNCDAVVDVSEHASPMTDTTITVDQNWPRETSGGLKTCGLEVEVLAPAGKAPTVVDIATITGAMVWMNNPAVTDTVRVIDTTKLLGVAGNLQLTKGVSNITQGIASSTSAGGKPGEELEYCISYKNVGTTPVSSMVMTDPIPFFTAFVSGSIKLNGVSQPDGATVANGFITVNVGAVAAGVGGTVCYRVTIK
jgi:uncharacterized repeat protein (TIGR01451 family)